MAKELTGDFVHRDGSHSDTYTPEQQRQYEWFVRRVVQKIEDMLDLPRCTDVEMEPEHKVNFAKRMTDAFISEGGLDLTEENAAKIAAVIVAFEVRG